MRHRTAPTPPEGLLRVAASKEVDWAVPRHRTAPTPQEDPPRAACSAALAGAAGAAAETLAAHRKARTRLVARRKARTRLVARRKARTFLLRRQTAQTQRAAAAAPGEGHAAVVLYLLGQAQAAEQGLLPPRRRRRAGRAASHWSQRDPKASRQQAGRRLRKCRPAKGEGRGCVRREGALLRTGTLHTRGSRRRKELLRCIGLVRRPEEILNALHGALVRRPVPLDRVPESRAVSGEEQHVESKPPLGILLPDPNSVSRCSHIREREETHRLRRRRFRGGRGRLRRGPCARCRSSARRRVFAPTPPAHHDDCAPAHLSCGHRWQRARRRSLHLRRVARACPRLGGADVCQDQV